MNSTKFKRKLADMICKRLQKTVMEQNLPDYQTLLLSSITWTEKQFELASDLTYLSSSTLRRIYLPANYKHTNFNVTTQQKICKFLHFGKWEDLVLEIENQIFMDKMKEV